MLSINCPTSWAILLFVVRDQKGVLRLPRDGDGDEPAAQGILFQARPLMPIQEQLVTQASRVVKEDMARRIAVDQAYADTVTLASGEAATLYLARLPETDPLRAPDAWPTFPAMLRALPSDRRRLPFLRAFQVASGALEGTVKAVDIEDLKKSWT